MEPEWGKRFPALYGYNPTEAKALLQESGYRPGTLKVKIVTFVDPGEAEGLQLAEALRLAREIGDFRFEQFADIPLLWLTNDVVASPHVVAEWTYPGIGPGGRRTSTY